MSIIAHLYDFYINSTPENLCKGSKSGGCGKLSYLFL